MQQHPNLILVDNPYRVTLASLLSRRSYHVALIVALLLSPLLLLLLFNIANPIESSVTATGRITRRGGSSYTSSSRAMGKAPT